LSSRADAPPYSDDASVLGRLKPLCRCSAAKQADCERIVAAAEASDAILAVGYIVRFARAIEWATAVLRAGLLGDVRSFDITWGQAFDWGIKSNSLWWREVSGGGVLMDFGTHI